MSTTMNNTTSLSTGSVSTVGTFNGTLGGSGGNTVVLGATTGTGLFSEEEINARDFAWFRGKHHDGNTILFLPPPQGWASQDKQPLLAENAEENTQEES